MSWFKSALIVPFVLLHVSSATVMTPENDEQTQVRYQAPFFADLVVHGEIRSVVDQETPAGEAEPGVRPPGAFTIVGAGLLAGEPPPSSATGESHVESIDAAREAAAKEVARLANLGGRFFAIDKSDLKDATLREPFRYYATSVAYDTTFFGYETQAPQDLLTFASRRMLCFPIDLRGSVVGTVNVAWRNARYEVIDSWGPGSDIVVRQLEDATRAANLKKGQRMSVLATNMAGTYFVVEDGISVLAMAPADLSTLRRFKLAGPVGGPETFADPSFFATGIKAEISKARRQMREASPPIQYQNKHN